MFVKVRSTTHFLKSCDSKNHGLSCAIFTLCTTAFSVVPVFINALIPVIDIPIYFAIPCLEITLCESLRYLRTSLHFLMCGYVINSLTKLFNLIFYAVYAV